MNEVIARKIRECRSLPTLPAVALKVLELTQREEVDLAEIARAVSQDPALASKLLATANSSLYGQSQQVSKLTRAMLVLGLQATKILVLGFSVAGSGGAKTPGSKNYPFWRRSIYSAAAAFVIARRVGLPQAEEVFVSSLLSDAGMLALEEVYGDQYRELCRTVSSHADLPAVEERVLGLTHAAASACLADHWHLPSALSRLIQLHHNPRAMDDPVLQPLANVAYLAGRCADVFIDEDASRAITDVRAFATATYAMPDAEADTLLDDIAKRTRTIAPLFDLQLESDTSFDAIIRKANDTIIRLTLGLQRANQDQTARLKEKAYTDGLTNLSNRARFDEFLREQFQRVHQHPGPLSLVMLDVDHFKSINDTRGHECGDQVLKALGQILRVAARAGDLAARYGGEELALILPGTQRATATAIAESVRRAVAARPVPLATGPLPVTLSIGVATHDPERPFTRPEQLLKAADMALYAAKHSGRNCVRVFTFKETSASAA